MTERKRDIALSDFLDFMLESICRIEIYIAGMDRDAFLGSDARAQMVRDAVVHNIGTIGEIANDICRFFPDFVSRETGIPFAAIYGMRNRVLHGYHAIDYDVVWTTCQRSLPDLKQRLREARERLS